MGGNTGKPASRAGVHAVRLYLGGRVARVRGASGTGAFGRGYGYELLAITAVVLGGADIMGGRGSIRGTLLGICAIVIVQNGLRVSALPAEFAGILTSVILVATIALGRVNWRGVPPRVAIAPGVSPEKERPDEQGSKKK